MTRAYMFIDHVRNSLVYYFVLLYGLDFSIIFADPPEQLLGVGPLVGNPSLGEAMFFGKVFPLVRGS
jgi:hypothetical protein